MSTIAPQPAADGAADMNIFETPREWDMRGSSRNKTVKTLDQKGRDHAPRSEMSGLASTVGDDVVKPVRVLIAEDHAVVREGTRKILERDPLIETVAEAADGREAVSLAARFQPDVILLDLRLPFLTGIEAIERIREASPASQVLVLSAYDEDDYIIAALDAGARGYLLKTAHGSEVIEAIHSVSRGGVVLHPAIAAKLLKTRNSERRQQQEMIEALSERENEILQLASRGFRNKDIARELGLSTRTVEGHLSHIFSKLGVSSRTEAIVFGVSHGWLHLADGASR